MQWSDGELRPKSRRSRMPSGVKIICLSSGRLFVRDVKALTRALFPAAMPSSSFASVPRAAGGDAGSLSARATAAIIKQRETFYFFVTDPASGKWQLAEGRETKQAFAGPEKASSPLWHFLAFFPPSPASLLSPSHPGHCIENLQSD